MHQYHNKAVIYFAIFVILITFARRGHAQDAVSVGSLAISSGVTVSNSVNVSRMDLGPICNLKWLAQLGETQDYKHDYTIQQISLNVDAIKAVIDHGDVRRYTNEIRKMAGGCETILAEAKLSEAALLEFDRRGIQAEIRTRETSIRYNSKFRSVEEEIRQLQSFVESAQLSNDEQSELDAFISDNSSVAKVSQARERAGCTTQDLRSQIFGQVLGLDAPNANSMGWCYAFAVSDLVAMKLGDRVSAVDLAINYNESDFVTRKSKRTWKDLRQGPLFMEGGDPALALEVVRTEGVCLEKDFRSQDTAKLTIKDAMTMIEEFDGKKSFAKLRRLDTAIHLLFPNVNSREFLKIAQSTNSDDRVFAMRDQACGARKHVKFIYEDYVRSVDTFTASISLSSVKAGAVSGSDTGTDSVSVPESDSVGVTVEPSPWNTPLVTNSQEPRPLGSSPNLLAAHAILGAEDLFAKLDQQLDRKGLALATYYHLILINPEAVGPADHGATIIGRRFNEAHGECEYMVRNAFGPRSCTKFNKGYDCDGHGNVWLPKRILAKSISRVIYLR